MDIKNILNESDRRANAARERSASRSRSPPSSEQHHHHGREPPPQPPAHQPPIPQPSTPAQQIIYTGPVLQFQPPVQVRHMGNTIHYRYTSPYPYDDPPPPVNYTVYQQYSQVHPHRHLPNPPRRQQSHYRPRSPTQPVTRPRRYPTFPTEYPPHHPPYRRPGLPPAYTQSPSPQHTTIPPPSHPFIPPDHVRHHNAAPPNQSSIQHPHSDPYLSYLSYPGPTTAYDPIHPTYSQTHPHNPDFQTYSPPSPDRKPFARPHAHVEQQPLYTPPNDKIQNPHSHPAMHTRNSPDTYHRASTNDQHTTQRHLPTPTSRPRKRERLTVTQVPNSSPRTQSHPQRRKQLPHPDDVSDVYSHQYPNDFHESSSLPHSPAKSSDPPPPNPSATTMNARARQKPKSERSSSAPKTHRTYSKELPPRKKKRLKKELSLLEDGDDDDDDDRPLLSTDKSKSPVSIDNGSVRNAHVKKEHHSVSADTSSCHDSDVVLVEDDDDDDSGTVSEHEDASSIDDESVRRRERDRERYRRSLIVSASDPDEPYPKTTKAFSGIPPHAVGDLLHLWEFVNAFSVTLRLSSFKLRHLEQAIVHNDRSPLLDACVTRLVRSILADKDLADELGVSNAVCKAVNTKSKNTVPKILESLHHILSFESDEVYDEFLLSTVNKLEQSSDKWAFYRAIEPAGRLRILRELVDYAVMTDKIRKCITDSMEHAEEEKKKAREENAANRKKLELQIKDLKSELFEYRTKNGLLDAPADSDREKSVGNDTRDGGGTDDNAGDSSKEGSMSRKEKLFAAKKERKEEEERRAKERIADGIIARIDKLRANLKMLKNLRLRNRTSACAKEGDLFDSSAPAPSMPFAAPHEDPVRSHPIGTDREDRRYWFFEGSGRIWIEDTSSGEWCTLNTLEGLDELLRWLSNARPEEQQLRKRIRQRQELIKMEMSNEEKDMELEEAEAQEAQESATEAAPRYTRAGKKRAEKTQKLKGKNKRTGTFLDYRNLVK